MTNPTISVCIPTHTRADLLSQALESLFVQSLPPSEVVVSDDAADPETARVVASFSAKTNFFVRYVNCSRRGSQAENLNCAIQTASSDLIVLLHDDDLLYPRALEALREPFLKVPELAASYGFQMRISDGGQELESGATNRAFFRVEEEAGLKLNSLRSAVLGQIPNDGFMVRTKVAKAVLYNPSYGGACDTEFGVRLAPFGPFYFVPLMISKYRLSRHSVLRGAGRKKDDTGYHTVRLWLELLEAGVPCKRELELRLRERVSVGIVQAAARGDVNNALSWLLGPYHRRKLFSLPGVKRALLVAWAWVAAHRRHPKRLEQKELQPNGS